MKYGIASTLRLVTEELRLQGYAETTVKSYRGAAGKFLRHVGKPRNRLTRNDVRKYMLYLAEAKYSSSTINQHHFAIRFLYSEVLKKKAFRMEQPLHKRPQRVPIVLAREEVDALFRATSDLQQLTIWKTLYSSGARLSEALRLQVDDIDSKDMRLLIRNGKGSKDRYTVLSQSLLLQLRSYWRVYRPTEWLFYGRDRQHHLVLRSVQKAFKEAKTRAGIRKRATPHSLRHSFATHSMEDGANLLYIRDLLGHRAIQSTLRYLKVTSEGINRLVNPLDRLTDRKPPTRPSK